MDGHETRHLVEKSDAALEIPSHSLERRGDAFKGLTDRCQPFHLHQPSGLFAHQFFKVVGVFPELRAHGDAFTGPFQCDGQHIVVDRLGDEIGRLELEALDGEVQVSVAGDHDDFCLRPFGLDPPQKFNAVQPRHFDVGKHNGRTRVPE